MRPILSENCFRCHGPPIRRRARRKLRLDIGDLAKQELPKSPGKYAVVAGHADKSELVRRITAQDPDERMPPESTHKTLSKRDIAILTQWIDNGAEYRPHWAFIEPQRPKVPSSKFDARAKNDIDKFVLSRLEREGVTPAARGGQGNTDQSCSTHVDGVAADARASRCVHGR